ncbi:hypothetical protein GCK32_005029 [Trichostrongylus colubriformis]|uniref:Uncharacterized protein n=1 Tax=Trichostrongylus colubriformis TaxID=6319 RepID=A0AAN8ILQ8_TRICO
MGENDMDIDGAPRTSTGSRPRKDYAAIINEFRSKPINNPCSRGKTESQSESDGQSGFNKDVSDEDFGNVMYLISLIH